MILFFWFTALRRLQVNWNGLEKTYTEKSIPKIKVFTFFLLKDSHDYQTTQNCFTDSFYEQAN